MNSIAAKFRWVLRGQDSASAALQTFLSKLIILAVGLLTSIITARYLGPDGRGEQAAIVLWVQFLAYMISFGLPVSLIYNLKRSPNNTSSLFSTAFLISFGLGMIAALIGVLGLPRWLEKYPPEVVQIAQWFMVGVPFTTASGVMGATLEGRGEFRFANKVRTLPLIITLSMLVGLVSTNNLTPSTSALAYFLPNIVTFFWVLSHLWSIFRPSIQSLRSFSPPLLSYGIRSYGIDILVTLSVQIDQVLVVGLLTPASMGLYVVALSLSRTLGVIQQSIVMVLFPKIAARSMAEVVETVGQAVRVGLVPIMIAAVSALLIGPNLIHLLYGANFLEIVTVFRILVVEVVLSGTVQILVQAFMALERPGIVTLTQGIGLGLTAVAMMLFVPTYGLIGAGLALLCSSAMRLIFAIACFPLVLKVAPPSLIFNRKDLQIFTQIMKRAR